MTRSISALLVATGLVLVLAACGESDEEKAQNKVCDARADIQKQVAELSNLTLATATVDGVKQNLTAIQDDLKQIKDAEGQLSDERRSEVETASQTFGSQVESIVGDLGSSLSVSGARSQLQSALDQLAQSYQQTLAPIDCG
jgi:hypothetical protein